MTSRISRIFPALCLLALLSACAGNDAPSPDTHASGQPAIAFGSCLRQWHQVPVLQNIAALSPKAFVFLGDNMYADVGDYLREPEPRRIAMAYRDLAANPDFQRFRRAAAEQDTALYATWDDHDYGVNDGGADYSHKLASKAYFLDFFAIRETAAGGAERPGIYHSSRLDLAGLDVQLLLLDTRSFRSPLKKDPDTGRCPRTKTVPETDPGATILGPEQWRWLEHQLRQPADLRLIASSIQVIPEEHCFEKWANFPLERQRLFDTIRATRAGGVVLISGDRHLAEISRLPAPVVGYPLYEVTASGLNSAMGPAAALLPEHNRFRVRRNFLRDNFGTIAIDKSGRDVDLVLAIRDADGDTERRVRVPLASLAAPPVD